MIAKLKNIILGWWYYLTGSNYELYKSRIEICKSCEHKIHMLKQDWCSVCGCALKAKTRVLNEKCLKGKW